ncbi:uncharacterized protein BJ171DRAFT_90391 [Polychytrium aggregatum]|uniref:uncharacterized protein n=1 Tax=Polychytrium aggregatum TaxID=110093 RepID=UPI0022FEDD75|nr:uncharacterized protein BJ171DRAFT_90391 [Polychytrium aggregatum]KAI9204826.1 hypothetical protein BJ171DRAFT_90391 [Polychytrium aggregatum]
MASLDMPSISATLSDPAMAQLLNSLCSSANLASIDGQGLPAVVPNVALDAVPPFLGLQRFGTVVNPAAGLPVVKRKRGRPVGKRDPEKERAKEAAKANAVASAAAAVAAGKKAAAATLAACTSAQRSTPSAPSIPTGAATSHVWQAGTRPAGSAVEAAKLPIMPLVKPSSTKAPAKTMPHQLKEQRKVAHSAIERRYRNNINDRIAELKAVIPALNASAACPSSDKFARGASHFGNEHECESDDDCEAEDSSVVIDGVAVAQKINKATILRKAAEYIAHLRRANQVLKDQVDSSRKCVQDHGSPELLLLLEDNLRAVKERHQTETVQRQVKLEDSPLSPVLSGVPSMSSPSTSCSHDSPPSSGFTSAQLHTDSPPPLVLESPTTSSEDESDGYPSPKRARHTGNPAAHVAPARMMMLVFVCACMLYAPNPFGSALVSLNGPASPDHHHSPARVFDAGLSSAMPGQPQTAVWSPEIMWPILRIVLTLLVLWKCLNPSMSTHTATFKPVKKPTDQYHSSQLSFEAEPSDVSQHCTSQLESPANKSRLWMLRLAQEAGAYLIGPRLCLGRAAVTNAGELHEYILLVRRLESDLLLKDNYQPLQLSQILRLANVANASPEILGAELCGRALLLCALRIQRAIVARHPPRKSGKAIKRPAVSATGSGHIMLLLWQQLSMSLLAKGIEMLQSAGASLTDPHLNWFLRVTREEKVNPMSLLDESVHTSSSESAGAAQPAQEAARSNLFAHAMASYRRSRLHELLGEAHVIRHLSLLPLHEEPAADPSGSVSPGIDGILAEIKRLGQASMDCQDFLGYAICELVQVGDMMRSGQTSEAVERYLALEQAIPPECLRQRYEVFSTLSLSVFLVACHYRQLNHAQQEQHISNSAGVLTTLSKQTDWVVCGWQELDRYTKEQLLHPSPNDRDGSSLVLLQAMFLNWALLTVPTGEGHHECGITSCAAGDSSRRCCLRTHADKVRFCMNDLIMGRLKASKGAARETLLEILKYWRQKTMLSE